MSASSDEHDDTPPVTTAPSARPARSAGQSPTVTTPPAPFDPPTTDPPTTPGASGSTRSDSGPGNRLPPPAEAASTAATRAVPAGARPGDVTLSWRLLLGLAWIAAFFAYSAVWQASVQIGIGTWWLGPRSSPQPLVVRLVPFFVTAFFGILASYNLRRLPWIGAMGALVLAAIAVPDLSRQTGLALVEFALAGAVLVISLAALTGTHRVVSPESPVPSDR